MSEPCAIAVLARAPVAGQAKTRLIPRLGAEGAARLHAALVERTLETAVASGLGRVTLWTTPGPEHPFFQACATRYDVALARQPDGDLGARMRAVFAPGAPTLLLGSDCPCLMPADLRAGAEALRTGAGAVLAPAEDGGYGLIGFARPDDASLTAAFGAMDWGVDTVLACTLQRFAGLGFQVVLLRTIWDVDRPGDLDRLAELTPPLAGT